MIDDDLFVKLFDSTPERQNGGDDDGPVYFDGGYAPSLRALKEQNENEPVGRQSGGSRKNKRKSKRQNKRQSKSKRKSTRKSYRRRR
jgi:hypothetical protein